MAQSMDHADSERQWQRRGTATLTMRNVNFFTLYYTDSELEQAYRTAFSRKAVTAIRVAYILLGLAMCVLAPVEFLPDSSSPVSDRIVTALVIQLTTALVYFIGFGLTFMRSEWYFIHSISFFLGLWFFFAPLVGVVYIVEALPPQVSNEQLWFYTMILLVAKYTAFVFFIFTVLWFPLVLLSGVALLIFALAFWPSFYFNISASSQSYEYYAVVNVIIFILFCAISYYREYSRRTDFMTYKEFWISKVDGRSQPGSARSTDMELLSPTARITSLLQRVRTDPTISSDSVELIGSIIALINDPHAMTQSVTLEHTLRGRLMDVETQVTFFIMTNC